MLQILEDRFEAQSVTLRVATQENGDKQASEPCADTWLPALLICDVLGSRSVLSSLKLGLR